MNNDGGFGKHFDPIAVAFGEAQSAIPDGVMNLSDSDLGPIILSDDGEWTAVSEAFAPSEAGDGPAVDPNDSSYGSHAAIVRRPDWDGYFLGIARAVARRGECTRRQVGAVLVKDKRIRATGYNGAPAGAPSCLEGACPRARSNVAPGSSYDTGAGACISIHAEANVLLFANKDDCQDATLYITDEPCGGCERLIAGSGVLRVVWGDGMSRFLRNPCASI